MMHHTTYQRAFRFSSPKEGRIIAGVVLPRSDPCARDTDRALALLRSLGIPMAFSVRGSFALRTFWVGPEACEYKSF